MKLSLYEQETIILYNQAEAAAEVYTHDPRLLEKLRRLAEKYPDQIVKKDRPDLSRSQTLRVPSENHTAPSAVRLPVNGQGCRVQAAHSQEGQRVSMAESAFEAVKQSVTVREAAQMYGIEVNRSGMACCPFHDDKNPSMKLNEEYFYCFGCGATGDVIDFTARLYNLSPKEAAEKLAQDFGLAYDSQAPPRRRYDRQKTEAQKFKEDRDHAFRVLADYYHLLRKWETDYSPKTPEENPHPRFMEAIQKKDYTGYLLDFFLEDGLEEQKLWIAEHQSEIANLERRVKIMADKPTNRERFAGNHGGH